MFKILASRDGVEWIPGNEFSSLSEQFHIEVNRVLNYGYYLRVLNENGEIEIDTAECLFKKRKGNKIQFFFRNVDVKQSVKVKFVGGIEVTPSFWHIDKYEKYHKIYTHECFPKQVEKFVKKGMSEFNNIRVGKSFLSNVLIREYDVPDFYPYKVGTSYLFDISGLVVNVLIKYYHNHKIFPGEEKFPLCLIESDGQGKHRRYKTIICDENSSFYEEELKVLNKDGILDLNHFVQKDTILLDKITMEMCEKSEFSGDVVKVWEEVMEKEFGKMSVFAKPTTKPLRGFLK